MKTKTIINIASLCLIMLAAFACASGGGGRRGLTVEDADIAVFPQLGHAATVETITFSPDGKYMASGSGDNTVKIWEVESGRELRTLSGHTDTVLSIAFSPDGKHIVSGSDDNSVQIWDVESGNKLQGFSGRRAAYSPDGRYIAFVASGGGRTIKIWDVNRGRELRTLSGHTDSVLSIAYSPDGKYIVTGSANNDKTVKIWDANSGRELRTLSGHYGGVGSVAYSPDGRYIVSSNGGYVVTERNTIKKWDANSGNEVWSFSPPAPQGRYNYSNSVAYSPDGKYIVSCDLDGKVRIYNSESGVLLQTLSGHDQSAESVAYSPDGKYIVSGAYGGNIRLWDIENGNVLMMFSGYRNAIYSTALSPDDKHIASGAGNTIRIWSIESGRELYKLSGHTGAVRSVGYSPDGKYIVSGSDDKTIRIWDAENGRELRRLTGHTEEVNAVAFSPDGKRIVSGSGNISTKKDCTVRIWDTESGRELWNLSGHTLNVYSVAFSPDGKRIVSGSLDQTAKIWDSENGRELRTLSGHNTYVYSVAFSPDGRRILTGALDGTIRIWDTESGQQLSYFGYVYGGGSTSNGRRTIAFSPDGKQVIAGSFDSTVKLWDAADGKLLHTFYGHLGTVYSVTFSRDGKQILSGAADGSVRIWDVATSKEIASLISFSGSDTQLAAASRGLTVETETTATNIEGEWLSITPDGYYQASPRGDRYLNVRVNNTVSGIDAYRSIFYNPDVVQARLQGLPDPVSTTVTIQQAGSFTPPTVTIQSPANFTTTNTATTNLSVVITSTSQPIRNIKILVNGRLVGSDELALASGTGLQAERASLTVTGNQTTVNFTLPLELEPGDNRIEVVAFNGYSENRRYVDVTRNAPAGERPPLPSLWILAVGVNGYDNSGARLGGLGNLNFAVADAKGLIDSLKAQEGRRYAKVNTMLIADGERLAPTAENIRQGFKFLEGADPRRDVVILFLAGHGISAQGGQFYFLPKDAAMGADRAVDASGAISGDEIMSVLDAPGNRLVFIDACQSGGVDSDRMVRSLMDTNAFVFAASRGNELSYEDARLGHGYFTYSIMSALGGAPAALAQGNVSVLSMSGYVKDDVPRRTNGRQNPSAYSLGFYDFPVAVIGR